MTDLNALADQCERRAKFDTAVDPYGLLREAAQALRAAASSQAGVETSTEPVAAALSTPAPAQQAVEPDRSGARERIAETLSSCRDYLQDIVGGATISDRSIVNAIALVDEIDAILSAGLVPDEAAIEFDVLRETAKHQESWLETYRADLKTCENKLAAIIRDEAAIRADEREKCAAIADDAELVSHDPSECRSYIADAIRKGGSK